jgi:putative ABC transport system permease protein
MSTALRDQPAAPARGENGGVAARQAVMRWAWRMFRREWRQQLLVLSLIVVAVAATFIGAAVATNTPPPANAGFGTATDLASFQAPDPHLAGQIASLRHRFGHIDVIENQTVAIPGSIETYDLRAQDPHGPFGQPMLSLVSGPPGDRHRGEPAEPGERVRPRGTAPGHGADPGHRAVRRAGGEPVPHRA